MSIATEITRLNNAKASIKTSIENKGVAVPSATKLDGYSALIDQISGGGSGVIDIATSAAMDDALVDANVGKIYRFTGVTNSKYVNGWLYWVQPGTPPIVYPVKGNIISMNLDGSVKNYRVVKSVSSATYEVIAMFNTPQNPWFNTQDYENGDTYEGHDLDTYLNATWYSTLTATAKAAIVDRTFTQDQWYINSSAGSPVYNMYYGETSPATNSIPISLSSATYKSAITRHVYAPSVQDVIDYVTDTAVTDGLLQNYNTWNLFWGDTVAHNETISLRSSFNPSWDYYVCVINGQWGCFYDDAIDNNEKISGITGRYTRPMMQIDLSKIDFTIVS